MAGLGEAEQGGRSEAWVWRGRLMACKEARPSDRGGRGGLPGRAAAQLVLQHNLREPQHVRGQAQNADVPKFFLVPLQPAVCPALEAERNVSSWLLCCPGSLTLSTSLNGDWTGSEVVAKEVWGRWIQSGDSGLSCTVA